MNANQALPVIQGAVELTIETGCELKLLSPDHLGAEIDAPVGTHQALIKNRGSAEWVEIEIPAGDKGKFISWGLPTRRWRLERKKRIDQFLPVNFKITFNGEDYLDGPGD